MKLAKTEMRNPKSMHLDQMSTEEMARLVIEANYEAVKAAEDKKYVLMNVPTERVDDVVSVLPGAKSPTVMPLATPGWSSVHTVIDEKRFWEIIRQLKEYGAQGILVLPVEKMIL